MNAQKSLAIVTALYPNEKWINTEPYIHVAKSRMIEKYREWYKWEKEMSQARILTSRGSIVCFLPEKKNEAKGKVYVDTVIDGEIVRPFLLSCAKTAPNTAPNTALSNG